jgi:mannose-6-phosphate isomerase
MHYSAGGVLFYEIMQNSDVIIGLRPAGGDLTPAEKEAKVRRALEGIHIEDGFECKSVPLTLVEGANRRTFVFACTYFVLERLDLVDPYTIDCDGDRFYVLSQIKGASTIVHGANRVPMRAGYTCLLPADLGEVAIVPDGSCALLKAYLPDLRRNVIAPLREAGFAGEDIAALAGQTRLNSLNKYL